MKGLSPLAKRILDRFEKHRREREDQQQQLDNMMKDLLALRERQASIAKHFIESIVLPRMEDLTRYFTNAKVEVLHSDAYYQCVCEFAHTPRFPATVKLGISLLPANDEYLTARYDLNILPVLMEYRRSNEERFPLLDGDEPLAAWVEEMIIEFVDTYLRLETHPLYQKDNYVLDIICGMRIPSTAATSSVERHGRTYYFCSEHCKEAFIKGESDTGIV